MTVFFTSKIFQRHFSAALLLFIMTASVSAQVADPLYVLYDKGCMRKYFYKWSGDKAASGIDYDEYHLVVNDSTIVVFSVTHTPENKETIATLPSGAYGCGRRNIPANMIQEVNAAKRPAYVLESAPYGYSISIASEVTTIVRTSKHVRFRNAEYEVTYNFPNNLLGGEVFGPGNNISALFVADMAVACMEDSTSFIPAFRWQETVPDIGLPSPEVIFMPDLGVFKRTVYNGEWQLTNVDKLLLQDVVVKICSKNFNLFDPSLLMGGQPMPAEPVTPPAAAKEFYVVKTGDNLKKISDTNPGISVENLIAWNGLSGGIIYPGMKLRLTPPKELPVITPDPEPSPETPVTPVKPAPAKENLELIDGKYYVVKPGDILVNIALHFNVPIERIKQLNKMKGDKLEAAQMLIIYDPAKPMPEPVADDEKPVKQPTKPVNPPTKPAQPVAGGGIHVVQNGETIYDIAEKYDVSLNDLITYNDLQTLSVTPGQRIIYKDGATFEAPAEPVKPSKTPGYHTVQAGETLSSIADKHQVKVSDIIRWNGLTTMKVNVDQSLRVTPPNNDASPPPPTKPAPLPPVETKPTAASGVHIAKEGDTFDGIASKYNVSIEDLIRWNNLTSLDITPGQKVIVADPAKKAPTPTPVTPTPGKDKQVHIVKKGDGLYSIAKKYGLTVDEVKALNGMTNNTINEGQVLIVSKGKAAPAPSPAPPSGKDKLPLPDSPKPKPAATPTTHTVVKGETLSSIARKYSTTADAIKKLNGLKSDALSLGQKLKIK